MTAVPTPVAADSTGLSDSQWVRDVRHDLRDDPAPQNGQWTADGAGGLFGATSSPLTIEKGPIYDGSDPSYVVGISAGSPAIYVTDSTSSTAYTVITSGTPTSGQVLINFQNRTLTFYSAPTSGHVISYGYYLVKWTDEMILRGLYAGLRQMFPSVGKTYVDVSIQIQVNVWDYTLPQWANSPDSQISKVEFRDPNIITEPWRPLDNWQRVGINQIHIPQAQLMSPTAYLRVTGWGPYIALGDLEPDLYHLPIWYCMSVLLPKQDSYRSRQDTLVPNLQEGAASPLIMTQTGDYYAKRFDAELKQKARAYGPPGNSRPIMSTYAVRRHI